MKLRRIAVVLAAVVLLGAPLWGPPLLRRLEVFRVTRVDVQGTRLLAPHEVLAASGIRAEDSVWDDPSGWEARLREHPGIAVASVGRSLPGTLHLRIGEKRPVGMVEAGTLRPATRVGEVFPLDPARAPLDLPLVRGSTAIGPEGRVRDPEVRSVLTELARIEETEAGVLARVSEARRTRSGDLLLVLSSPRAEVLLPYGAGVPRLRHLRATVEDLERRAPDIDSDREDMGPIHIDLRFVDLVVVRHPSRA